MFGAPSQVKPLLQVTNNEDKLNAKEEELRRVVDRFDLQKRDYDDLEKKKGQLAEEKNILSEQLQAETELCAEAEEVRWRPLVAADNRSSASRRGRLYGFRRCTELVPCVEPTFHVHPLPRVKCFISTRCITPR